MTTIAIVLAILLAWFYACYRLWTDWVDAAIWGVIGVMLIGWIIFGGVGLAHADEYGTPDKRQHALYSGIGTTALYPVARSFDVKYPKATAAGTMFALGVVKELLDPLGSTPTPTSGKDIAANAIGIAGASLLLYGGELIEDEYGWNPFYWKF